MGHDRNQPDDEHTDQHDRDREDEPARVAAAQPEMGRHDGDLSLDPSAASARYVNVGKACSDSYTALLVTRPVSAAGLHTRRGRFRPAAPWGHAVEIVGYCIL